MKDHPKARSKPVYMGKRRNEYEPNLSRDLAMDGYEGRHRAPQNERKS